MRKDFKNVAKIGIINYLDPNISAYLKVGGDILKTCFFW